MGQFSDQVLHVVSTLTSRAAVSGQGGILAGDNPVAVNLSDPLRLWVVQVTIIVVFTQLLSLLFARMRQPRVIAEIFGGVILGPSVMGRIPHFTATIFPAQSIPLLSLASSLGLIYFLFIVGLELDISLMKRSAKTAAAISFVGLGLPLALGALLAIPIYNEFISEEVKRSYFILFIAVAVGITAFPILCRILANLSLFDTPLGVTVMSAGVSNDIVGWILLALAVALVNTGNGLTALWVLLVCAGYALFLIFPVRLSIRWLAKKTGSLEGNPSPLITTIAFLLVLISAFFTDIIGVHAIFGGFLAGLAIPHDGNLPSALVEKVEDIITIIFLPVYFAISGLNTNLGTLNDRVTWAYTVLVCAVAFFGKFLGCSVTAKFLGFTFRESGAIGTLMACKGLIELIVINIGLQAKILDTRVFTMFVVHALVLTFLTTPVTTFWLPLRLRKELESRAEAERNGQNGASPYVLDNNKEEISRTSFTVVLNRIDQLPALATLTNLLKRPVPSASSMSLTTVGTNEKEKEFVGAAAPITINALRLIELSDRTSDFIKTQEAEALIHKDLLVTTFRTFGLLNHIPVFAKLAVVRRDEFSHTVSSYVQQTASPMVIIPWNTGLSAPQSSLNHEEEANPAAHTTHTNPFESIFGHGKHDLSTSVSESQFARKVFSESPSDVALYLDRGLSISDAGFGHHIFLPFFGGPDDRLALSFVVQLCANPSISATIVRITKVDEESPIDDKSAQDFVYGLNHTVSAFPETIYEHPTTHTRLASDTADNLAWARYANTTSAHPPSVSAALTRITFNEASSANPLKTVLDLTASESRQAAGTWKNLVVVVGRSRRMAVEDHLMELKRIMSENKHIPTEIRGTFGDVAAALISVGHSTGLLILQASMKSETL